VSAGAGAGAARSRSKWSKRLFNADTCRAKKKYVPKASGQGRAAPRFCGAEGSFDADLAETIMARSGMEGFCFVLF